VAATLAALATITAVAPQARAAAPTGSPLQVAGESPPPPRLEQYPTFRYGSDGAGPRITFGRTFTEPLNEGFFGRVETEYFEVHGAGIAGVLVGLEGWGTEGATSGGGAVPITVFGGVRGGPFHSPKAPVFFLTAGIGLDLVVYDRVEKFEGFGLLSPIAVATAGMEIVPGVRLLVDGRAVYRWHWTAPSNAQLLLGLTLGLNSYLWDGP
jgi:hypothetical protein